MKLAKRALVLLLTLAMLVGCIPAFSVAAKEAVIEGVSTPTVVITSYEQIYVKDGLVLLSTVYGNEGDGNIDLSTGVWNNRVGDDNIAIVGYAREEGGYNGAYWTHMFARSKDLITWETIEAPLLTQTNADGSAKPGMGYDGPCWMIIGRHIYVYMRVKNRTTAVELTLLK